MGGRGSGGNKPKPAEIREITGNPGHRPIPATPAFASGGLVRPAWFTAVEKSEWNRLVPEGERVKLTKGIHQGALEGICGLYGSWRKAWKDNDMQQFRMSYDAYRKALNEFGFTPASAGRVGSVGGNEDQNPEDEFFDKKPRLVS